jgi:hypothetical protein
VRAGLLVQSILSSPRYPLIACICASLCSLLALLPHPLFLFFFAFISQTIPFNFVGPIAAMFWLDDAIMSQLYLDGIVAVVDGRNALTNLRPITPDPHLLEQATRCVCVCLSVSVCFRTYVCASMDACMRLPVSLCACVFVCLCGMLLQRSHFDSFSFQWLSTHKSHNGCVRCCFVLAGR